VAEDRIDDSLSILGTAPISRARGQRRLTHSRVAAAVAAALLDSLVIREFLARNDGAIGNTRCNRVSKKNHATQHRVRKEGRQYPAKTVTSDRKIR
jgi:hypothetical protein